MKETFALSRSLRIARIDGIPLAINVTWPLIFLVVTWSLAESYFPARVSEWAPAARWGIAAVASLLLFASVLAHELAHAFAARHYGLGVEGIDLFLFGGVARLSDEPDRPEAEFVMAAAGPACSLFLAGLGGACFAIADHLAPLSPFNVVLEYFVITNLALGIFNLAPGFPLDGGRMLRAVLWHWPGDRKRATAIASGLGQLVGAGLVLVGTFRTAAAIFSGHHLLGVSITGLWLVLTGWFLIEAARAAYQAIVLQEEGARLRLGDVTTASAVPFVGADLSIESLMREYVVAHEYPYYPVVDGNTIVGVIGVDQIASVPRDRWGATAVRALLSPLHAGQVARPTDRAAETLRRMAHDGLNRLLVVDRGRVIGVITRHQLNAALGRK